MKIKFVDESKETYPTIEQFAEENDLTMLVTKHSKNRYTADFEDCEVKDGGMLMVSYGDDTTKDRAIKAYAREISNKVFVYKARNLSERREIKVPNLKV